MPGQWEGMEGIPIKQAAMNRTVPTKHSAALLDGAEAPAPGTGTAQPRLLGIPRQGRSQTPAPKELADSTQARDLCLASAR